MKKIACGVLDTVFADILESSFTYVALAVALETGLIYQNLQIFLGWIFLWLLPFLFPFLLSPLSGLICSLFA